MNRLLLLVLPLFPFSSAFASDAPAALAQKAAADGLKTLGTPGEVRWAVPPAAPRAAAGPGILSVECEKFKSPLPWEYCLTRTAGSANPTLLYFMHGLGDGARSWTDPGHYTGRIRQAWAASGKQAPTVVTISFGPFWLLSEKNASPHSGLLDFLVGQAIPEIERREFGGVARRRILMGESMGGFNATALVLEAPGLFERAALVCPAIASISPYSNPAEVQGYIARTGADPAYVDKEVQLARAIFPDEASWEQAAPLTIGKTLLGPGTPPLNVSCGDRDQYGFTEGAKLFADLAKSKGVSASWELLSGGHCVADPAALANFLIP